mmetsp:Transcript_94359/g.197097  ORF Transcript_94359/g.197097 Transcript_94359/m.197097 type:complete len:1298 (-) Transcript_94359:217-4110(-)
MGDLINDAGIWLCTTVVLVLVFLALLNGLFQFNRKQVLDSLQEPFGKPLTFHSPDDSVRTFKQYGFVYSTYGAILLHSWVALFAIGYIYMILFCWLSYSPQFLAPGFALEYFGGWNGLMAPWLLIFTIDHILGMVLIFTWEAMRTRFMYPVSSLADATHVMIEEELPFMTEDFLVDPDTEGHLDRLKRHGSKVQARFKRAKCRTVVKVDVEKDGARSIEYTCVRYIHSEEDDCFHPTGIVDYTAAQVHEAVRRGGLTSKEAKVMLNACGKNEINVHVPSILEALLTEFSDFTYIFNSIGTWSYMVFSSWNIGLFWLLLTLGSGIFRSLFIVRPNQKKIHELAQLHTECEVLRDGKWTTIRAADIVLGDVVAIEDNSTKLPCDGLVVEGSLVVNESMLTGEPMPIQKMPVEKSDAAVIGKKNLAYAGTACLESSGPHDNKALLIATAVGALTTRGQLVRMVLFPTSVRFKYNDQLPKVYMLLSCYMVILFAIYLSPKMNLHSWVATYLLVLNTIAMCLSPMLPVSMVMGQSAAANRLEKTHKIGCLQPGRIPIAGKISTMVFDKTGTITKDGMDFDAVIPVEGAKFSGRVSFMPNDNEEQRITDENRAKIKAEVPERLRHALACCHTVAALRDGTLVGNHVEVSMVTLTGWSIGEKELKSPSGDEALEVVKKLDFDHSRMTSGVVVRNSQTKQLVVYVKGSYEKIKSISESTEVPETYDEVTQKCAKDGYYTLGIATKLLDNTLTEQQIADMTRDSLEAGLGVCGLMLFRNEMKRDSPDAIRELKKGSIRSVICTGDNALTGISIGKQCGIASQHGKVLLGEVAKGGEGIEWRDPDSESSRSIEIGSNTYGDCQLAVTQGAWRHLHEHLSELEVIWPRIVVFARMKPEDKINVVKYFQSRALVVGMCGDGGNDCGGLRAAHAGLALSDAEASMVSPFATGRDGKSLMTVVDLIREGRACLSTNMATFQYFMVYAFTLTTIRTILVWHGALNLGEYVWVTMDIGIGMIMIWTMTLSKPTGELCHYRPTATLLGPRTLSAIAFPYITAIITLFVGFGLLWSKDWYEHLAPINDIHLLPSLWMLRGDNYDSSIGAITLVLALVNTGYVNTYGGAFRRNILTNIGVNVVYFIFLFALGWLLLSSPTQFNCVFRVNCDNKQSQEAKALTPLALFSAGGVGNCFLGPQVKIWQAEMQPVMPPEEYWLPDDESGCTPPSGSNTTPWSSPDISQFGCEGPNNCFSTALRWQLVVVFVAYILVNHLFTKLFLQGPVAARLRQMQKRTDEEQGTYVPSVYNSESDVEL